MKKISIFATFFLMGVLGTQASAANIIANFSGLDDASNNNNQQGWLVSGIMDEIGAAKYLVIETKGVGNNKDGFGGIQFIFQGNNGDSVSVIDVEWTQVELINGGWQSFPRAEGKTVSIVIDLKNVVGDNYDDFLKCTGWARILLGYYEVTSVFEGLALKNVYLTEAFDKPADAVDLAKAAYGFIFEGSVTDEPTNVIMDFSQVDRVNNGNSQQGWDVGGIMKKIGAAKYLVIETEGVGNNPDGFGTIQFIFQGGDSTETVGWTQPELISEWLAFPRAEGKTVSIVVDIKNVMGDKYEDFLKCGWAKIFLGYYEGTTAFEGLAFKNAYLSTAFDKPGNAVNLNENYGFIFANESSSIENIVLKAVLPFFAGTTLFLNDSGSVQIFDMNGRILLTGKNVSSVDLSALSNGVYIAKAIINGQVQVIKIVK